MQDDFKYTEVATGLPAESALDLASILANFVPFIGGPLNNVLNGMSVGRKFDRVQETIQGMADDLRDFKSEASEKYVKSEEFEDLLAATLQQAANERSDEKRQMLSGFLVDSIKQPKPYSEQNRIRKLIEDLESEHVLILRAMSQSPRGEEQPIIVGSPMGTLRNRLPALEPEQIQEIIHRLNDLRLTNIGSLNAMMSGMGAADLSGSVTPVGRRLLNFLKKP